VVGRVAEKVFLKKYSLSGFFHRFEPPWSAQVSLASQQVNLQFITISGRLATPPFICDMATTWKRHWSQVQISAGYNVDFTLLPHLDGNHLIVFPLSAVSCVLTDIWSNSVIVSQARNPTIVLTCSCTPPPWLGHWPTAQSHSEILMKP
jgi:hypothetical protein